MGDLPEPISKKLKLIIEPEPSRPSSPRGLLPKASAEDLPQELDLVPEPEHHYQKFSQLNYLQQQIDELKNMISDELLSKSRFGDEYNSDKSFKIEESVKDIERSEQNEIEYEIIQTLLNQNKKLGDVEKKLYKSNQTK